MNLKEKFEDLKAWLLDKYEAITDKIGKPAFFGIIAVIIILIVLAFIFLSGQKTVFEEQLENKFTFVDLQQKPIANLKVNVIINDSTKEFETNSKGEIIVNAPLNSSITINVREQTINNINFQPYSETFEVSAALAEKITILTNTNINFQQTKTLFLQGPDGLPINKELTVKLECLDSSIPSWTQTDVEKIGKIVFELPLNCTKVKATLMTPNFDSSSIIFLPNEAEKTMIVSEIEPEKGSLEVVVQDSAGQPIITTNFLVRITYNETGETFTEYTQYYGSASFKDLLPGYYDVSVSDESNNYGIATKENVLIEAKKEAQTFVTVSKTIKGTLKVTVIDKANKQRIANAIVSLKDSTGKTLAEKNTDANAKTVEFAFTEEMQGLSVTAKKIGSINEGYFPKTIAVQNINSSITIELEKITSANAGRAIVHVIDEDNAPVKNAKVMFRYKKNGSIVELTEQQNFKLSDANGNAEFILGPIEEEIYAFASKYPATGGKPEEAKKIDLISLNEFTVQMNIGNATINVSAKDIENNLVTGGNYEIFNALGQKLSGTIPLETGQDSYTLKADEKVFVLVRHPSYLSYQSKNIQLWPEKTFNVEALMLPKQDSLEIQFEGFYLNETKTEVLDKGQEYNARFKLIVPDQDFKRIGMHFRLGDSFTLENELMYIKQVNASNASLILKGETFNPENNGEEKITEGAAKWVNIEWQNSNNRTIEVEITIKLKENIPAGSKLSFYYRAWAVTQDDLYLRDPFDTELGNAESTSKNALYAETYQAIYLLGITRLCEELYCYGKEDLFDEKEQLYLVKPYSLSVFSPYTLSFEITSNDDTKYNALELLIKNSNLNPQAIKIKSYELKQANGQTISATLNEFETPRIQLNEFVKGKKIAVKLSIEPQSLGNGVIEIHLIGDNRFIWQTQIDSTIISDNELKLSILPEVIPAFTPTILQVKVTDKDDLDVKDALVRTTIVFKDHTEVSFEAYSNSMGYAIFPLLALSPGTIIKVKASKLGFASIEGEKKVSEEVVEIKPETISFSLNTVSKTEDLQEVTIKNLLGVDLKITDVRLKGNFKGLLDEAAMNAFLKQSIGTKIAAGQEIDLALVKAILSVNAKELMNSNKNLEGEIGLTLSVEEFGSKFNYKLPLSISITLGEMPENTACLILDGVSIPDWKTATQNNSASMQFTIANACTSAGRKIDLETLEAKLEFDSGSPKAGTLTLSIQDPAGNIATETLQEGSFIVFFKNIKTIDVGTYNATLTFTPKQGFIGKKASFKVSIAGTIKTATGKQYVASSPEKINGEISVINLDECIKFYDKSNNETLELKMKPEEDSISFTVNSENCGEIPITISLCPEDNECKGGTDEGGIRLSSTDFTLNPSNPTKTITIERKSNQIPGIYGIPVYASTPASSSRQINELTVEIKPKASQYFDLDKYEFYVQGLNAQDSTALINRMYVEPVTIKADLCAWKESIKQDNSARAMSAISTGAAVAYIAIQTGLDTILANAIGAAAAMAGPIGVAIGIVVAIIIYFALGKSCHDDTSIHTLEDYVINLAGGRITAKKDTKINGVFVKKGSIIHTIPSDAGTLTLKGLEGQIKMEWVLDNPIIAVLENGRQTETVGLKFTNNSGLEKEKPSYAIGVIQAKEHIHGDPLHKFENPPEGTYDVYCHNGNFFSYWIGGTKEQGSCEPTENKDATPQKFHLRFITKQEKKTMPPVGEAINCYNGNLIGNTGRGALPRIKLKWGWLDSDISAKECDISNKDAIYCDATQFSIMISKRLKMLEDFMAANNYSFSCPLNPEEIQAANSAAQQNAQNSSQEIPEGKLGLKQISATVNGKNAKITVVIENKTTNDVDATVLISVSGPDDYSNQCTQTKNVIKNTTTTIECSFENLTENSTEPYVAGAQLSAVVSGTTTTVAPENIITNPLAVVFIIGATQEGECWLPKTTALISGIPGIEYYINKGLPVLGQYVTQQSVRFTNDIKSFEDLRNLLHFRAYLIKDNYNEDFMKDFAEFYTTSSFFDAPTYFKAEPNGKLADYFMSPSNSAEKAGLQFTQKYLESPKLPGPGSYLVDIDILYLGDNWSLYKQGKPNAWIQIVLYKIDEPFPNFVLYYMPFDGLVGINSANGRQDYGINYLNLDEPIIITDRPTIIKTDTAPASNALVEIKTRFDQSIENINSRAQTRGVLLQIKEGATEKEKELIFSPSYATPIILKATENKIKEEKSSVFYSLLKNAQPELTGNSLAYWTGLGSCLDFTGIPVKEAFNFNSDRKSLPEDKITDWQFSYAIDWKKISNPGVVFLNSIIYTPVVSNNSFELKANSQNLKFISPDYQETEKIPIQGIKGMQNNDRMALNYIDKLQEVIDLVAEGKACVSNTGTELSIAWNPATILTTKGNITSIEEFERNLKAGENCIGYGK